MWYEIMKELNCKASSAWSVYGREKENAFTYRHVSPEKKRGDTSDDGVYIHNDERTWDQLREYALREIWEFFVDDRPFCRNACFRHANVQSKVVVSIAMTMGRNSPHVRGSTPNKRTNTTPNMEEYLQRRMMSVMLCMNFDDHEWVSESTITQHVEEVMGMELDYEIGILCVVQWCMLWVFSTSEVESNIGKQRINIAVYHDAVNMEIAYAISRPCGGAHTPRSCMLTTVAGILYTQ